MKTAALEMNEVKQAVRQRYGSIATAGSVGCGAPRSGEGAAPAQANSAVSACGCSSTAGSCCTADRSAADLSADLGYALEQTNGVPEGANLGLGCGNPLAIASLRPGQTVLDLGSGAGFDAFLAAKAVGPKGRVIGVDMTPEMITKARANQTKGAYDNVEFRLGEIESLPVADNSVDVIISNCVINLSPDKGRVFREAFRVLKPDGRVAVSDIVALAPIPDGLRRDWDLYTGCVAGAAPVSELKHWLADAGFKNIRVEPKARSGEVLREWFPGQGVESYVASANIEAVKPNR